MDRTIRIKTSVSEEKFRLIDEYKGVGIYQEITPYGYRVHQSYGFQHKGKFFVSYSFMNNDIEDIYDYIDNYNHTGKYGFKVMLYPDHYCLHQNGQINMQEVKI